MADCHIGSWRNPKLKDITIEVFKKAVSNSIERRVQFILISGDLFNTALPAIDKLKAVVEELRKLKKEAISVYVIPGSHDYSPSGKTMLEVLEAAGLIINVVKGTVIDGRLRLKFAVDGVAKITGLLGKRGMLEKSYYQDLDREHLEQEDGFKIFMFHTAISELKSDEMSRMESAPLSLLPKGFDYYAGGHVHERQVSEFEGYKKVVYPGPLFPNSFKELENKEIGGFYVYDDGDLEFVRVNPYDVENHQLDCSQKTAEEVEAQLYEIARKEHDGMIVTLRITGVMSNGRLSDIDFKGIMDTFYEKGAALVLKNTIALKSGEFEEVKVNENSVEEIEETLIDEHKGKIGNMKDEKGLTVALMNVLNSEKAEGETSPDFSERLIDDARDILDSF